MTSTSLLTLSRVAIACLTVMLCLSGTALAVSKPQGLGFRAEPSVIANTDPNFSYFLIDAQPGANVSQSIDLTNISDRTIMLILTPVTATTGPLGGVSYATDTDPDASKWIQIAHQEIRLAPHVLKHVPFTVHIPTNSVSGTHVVGLTVAIAAKRAGEPAPNSPRSGASVMVHNRRVIAVEVQVPGPLTTAIAVERVSTAPRADAMYLQIGIRNTGNTLTKATGELTFDGPARFHTTFSVDTMVPATAIAYPIKWTALPRAGTYHADIRYQYAGRTEHWSGTFTVDKAVLRQYADRSGTNMPDKSLQPVILIIAVAVALGVLTGLLIQLRRRRYRQASASASMIANRR